MRMSRLDRLGERIPEHRSLPFDKLRNRLSKGGTGAQAWHCLALVFLQMSRMVS